YFSSTNHRVGAFDLETEKIVWEKTYDAGCDRSAITMDGTKLYVPTGWWYSGDDSGVLIVNAENGELIKRINVGPQAHNSIVSLDGRPMRQNCGSVIRWAKSCSFSMPRKCPPLPRASSSCPKAVTAGSRLVSMVNTYGPTRLTSSTPAPRNGSPY